MKIGFGIWRLFLALMVAISHLWSGMIDGPAAYAVWGFFLLSGFLMTAVLNKKYGENFKNLKYYALNRILRIYPLYWIGCIFGLIVILVLRKYGIETKEINHQFFIPNNYGDYWYNLTLIPIIGGSGLLVPVASALAIEVAVYFLIPFFAFSKRSALAVIIISLIINLRYNIFDSSTFVVRYTSLETCLLPFAIGSLVYQIRNNLTKLIYPKISLILWGLNCIIWVYYDKWPWTLGLYTSIVLSAWVTISIYKEGFKGIESFFGDMSYPLYLYHTTIGALVLLIFEIRTLSFMLLSLLITLIVSYLAVKYIDSFTSKFKINPKGVV